MSLPTSIIIRVMCRCDLDGSCSEISFHKIISNNYHLSIWDEWVNQLFSYKLFVAFVFRIYGNGNIAKHCFDSCCGHFDLSCWVVFQFVGEEYEDAELDFFGVPGHLDMSCFFDISEFDLDIGDCGF